MTILFPSLTVPVRLCPALCNFYFLRVQICFLCMKTRFGLFSRGTRCEMCRQLVCSKCFAKVGDTLIHHLINDNHHHRCGFLWTISPRSQCSPSARPEPPRSRRAPAWWRPSRRRCPPSRLISPSSTPPPRPGARPPPPSPDGRCRPAPRAPPPPGRPLLAP